MGNNRQEQIKNAFEEFVGKGNLDIVEEALAEGYIAHAGEKEFRGHASIKESAAQFRSGMPDLHIVEIKFLAQDADNVVWQRTLEGTHEGEVRGIPASGKKVKWVDEQEA